MMKHQKMQKTTQKIKGKILKTYYTAEGTLYEGDVVIVEEQIKTKTRVTDLTGRIFWIKSQDVKIR